MKSTQHCILCCRLMCKDGREKKNNKIAFAGYEAVGAPEILEVPEEAPAEEAEEPVFVEEKGTEEEVPF